MKKIFIYTENYLPGGGNRYLVDFINNISSEKIFLIASNENGLLKNDFDSIRHQYYYSALKVLTFPIFNDMISKNFKNRLSLKIVNTLISLKVIKLFLLLSFKLHNERLFGKIFKKMNPDLVISFNGGFPAALSCLDLCNAAYKSGIKNMLSVVSMPQSVSALEKFFYSRIKDRLSGMIVNSKSIKNEFIRTRSFNKEKIEVLYNTVDTDLSSITPDNFFRKFKLKHNETIIGYSGRIERQKGIFFLLEAFSMLLQFHDSIRLILVGMGNDFDEIKKLVFEKKMEDHVVLTGFYDGNIYEALMSFDLFVFPSLWEGFPYSLLEAMNAGKIIISSDVGGIPELVHNNHDGILVKPSDANVLFEKLHEVINHIKEHAHLGINARKKIVDNFSYDSFYSKVNSIITKIGEK